VVSAAAEEGDEVGGRRRGVCGDRRKV